MTLSPGCSRLVLVVDDDPDVRDTLAEVLMDAGFTVVCAGDGREALAVLHAGTEPGVILLDLMMPGMDGYQFRSEQLRDPALRGIPVIIFTAGRGALQRQDELSAAAYLPKPVDLRDLLASLASIGRFGPG